jgi:hypothetical protein
MKINGLKLQVNKSHESKAQIFFFMSKLMKKEGEESGKLGRRKNGI